MNSNNYRDMYKELGIDIDALGCIMLDIDASDVPNLIDPEELYFTSDPKKFWIKGFVASAHPHVTLMYGLLEQGIVWKQHVDKVLEGWDSSSITIDHVGFFPSPYKDEPYSCIVAHVDASKGLLEAHERLSLLPHINTFPGYKAHMTLAYVKNDPETVHDIIHAYDKVLKGTKLPTKGINYGQEK